MTFDNVLEYVVELPPEQQISLIDIIQKRLSEKRREEISYHAKKEIENFRNGMYKPETAEVLIERLHKPSDIDEL